MAGRLRRYIKRTLLTLVTLVVVAIATVLIALHTSWGRDKIRGEIQAALQDSFPGGAKVGAVEGSVFGELVVTGIEIDGMDHHPMVTIGSLKVRVALSPLLSKRVKVESLVVDDVRAFIHPEPPDPPKDHSGGGSDWLVELPDVRVSRAHVEVRDYGAPITIDNIAIIAHATIPGRQPIAAGLSVSGRWTEGATNFGVAAEAVIDGGTVIVPNVVAFADHAWLAGTKLSIDPAAPHGTVALFAPAATLARIAPDVTIPGDVAVSIEADPLGKELALAIDGSIGDTTLRAWMHGTIAKHAASGVVIATAPDLAPLTDGAVAGSADVTIVASTDGTTVRGVVFADEKIADAPPAHAIVALDGAFAKAKTYAIVTGDGARATISGELVKTGKAISISRADAIVSVVDPERASQGRFAGRGAARVTASIVDGALSPLLALRVTGRVAGSGIRVGDTAVAGIDGYYTGRIDAGRIPIGTAHLDVRGIAQGDVPFGSASIDAVSHADKSVDLSVHANPRPATTVALDARVIPRGDTIQIALGNHHVGLPDGRELAGSGGTVTIAPRTISAANITTSHRGGKVVLGSASFDRETAALAATLDVATLPVGLIDPRARGDASGHVKIDRTRGVWHGDAKVSAAGVVIDDRLSIDSTVHAKIDGRRISLEVGTTLDPTMAPSSDTLHLGALHGAAEVALAIDGPVDPTNAKGWLALTRKDVRAASITLKTIDLGLAGGTGTVDGTILITPTDTHGSVDIAGIKTPAGTVSGTATFDNDKGDILVMTKAMVEGVGAAKVEARVGLPEHLFDPAAWKLLGRDAVREVVAQLDEVAFDPAMLARLGITAPYHGRARLEARIARGITGAHLEADLDGVAGGVIAKPVELHASADMDGSRSAATVDLFTAGKGARKSDDVTGQLLHAEASIPVTFESWMANGLASARTAALKGTVTIPKADVATILAIVGRKDVTKGTIDGSGKLGGTFQMPTGTLAIAAHGVVVPPLVTGRLAPVLDELEISGSWGGVGGSFEITGRESDGGRLKVTAKGRPDDLAHATATVDVKTFNIAPLAAFAPGALVSTTGTIDGHVDVTGFDLATMSLGGNAVMSNGRVPLSPLIGTMRDTSVTLVVKGRKATLVVTGKLGACNVDGHRCRVATVQAEATPELVTAKLTLDHIQPITATQPDISAIATTTLKRDGDHWQGTTRVSSGVIVIPRVAGSALLSPSAPSDMVFVDAVTPIQKPVRGAPERPWLVTDVTIESTQVFADELRGSAKGSVQISLGDGAVGMLGLIEVEQGVADIFNHRYQVDHGDVTFDGTTDAQLDLRLVHDFAAMTLVADVSGRISKPELALSSEPGTFTEGQLLGFFLGGEPGGDPNANTQTGDAATAAGSSLLSQKIGRAANKILPVQIDVFNCSVATTSTSTACTVGKWLGPKLFIAYKQHLAAKPDENAIEGAVEYYIRHDILLEGNVGDRSYDGLDLLWRHRW